MKRRQALGLITACGGAGGWDAAGDAGWKAGGAGGALNGAGAAPWLRIEGLRGGPMDRWPAFVSTTSRPAGNGISCRPGISTGKHAKTAAIQVPCQRIFQVPPDQYADQQTDQHG